MGVPWPARRRGHHTLAEAAGQLRGRLAWPGHRARRSSGSTAHPGSTAGLDGLCPAGAISVTDGPGGEAVRLDQGRCILSGRCVLQRPDLFGWSAGATGSRTAALVRDALIVPGAPETDEAIEAARVRLRERTAALRRSVHVRHVDAGSDGSEEWEVLALLGPVYDIHRLGVFFTASPRHADILLVTGAGSVGMAGPLRATYEAMPDPRVVVATGTDAVSGGLLRGSGVTPGGAAADVPVDVWLPDPRCPVRHPQCAADGRGTAR